MKHNFKIFILNSTNQPFMGKINRKLNSYNLMNVCCVHAYFKNVKTQFLIKN